MDEVTVLRPGLVLEVNKSVVLQCKASLSNILNNTSLVLCVWAQSPVHPFVIWKYNEITGELYDGEYHSSLDKALIRFKSAL